MAFLISSEIEQRNVMLMQLLKLLITRFQSVLFKKKKNKMKRKFKSSAI